MIEFTLPPSETIGNITFPASKSWREVITQALSNAASPCPTCGKVLDGSVVQLATCAEAAERFVGWTKYLPVPDVAAALAKAGWEVQIHNSYAFRAKKGKETISAETKARFVNNDRERCWSFSFNAY